MRSSNLVRHVVLVIALAAASSAYAQTDWPTFGHDLAGTRYSTLKQIDTKNVNKLVRAWTYHMNAGEPPAAAEAAPAPGSSEAGDAAAGGRGGHCDEDFLPQLPRDRDHGVFAEWRQTRSGTTDGWARIRPYHGSL